MRFPFKHLLTEKGEVGGGVADELDERFPHHLGYPGYKTHALLYSLLENIYLTQLDEGFSHHLGHSGYKTHALLENM